MPVLEWVNTSTLSELCSAVNKLSRLFNITYNSFAVSDNNIDYMLIRLYDFCEVLALHGQSIIMEGGGGREGGREEGREEVGRGGREGEGGR